MAVAIVSGPAKWDKSRMGVDEGKLKSEVIFREDRRYYMDLKENHRGRFLKVSYIVLLYLFISYCINVMSALFLHVNQRQVCVKI